MRTTFSRLFATSVATAGFVLLYEATTYDSRTASQRLQDETNTAPLIPGAHGRFIATAYCKGITTASGIQPRSGIAAADPKILPVGSVIRLDVTGDTASSYNGIYTVMDTGPRVMGRHVDLYVWSCYEALDFGRRPVDVRVLRLGWNPSPLRR